MKNEELYKSFVIEPESLEKKLNTTNINYKNPMFDVRQIIKILI